MKDENRSSHTYWDRKDNITYSSNYDITGDFSQILLQLNVGLAAFNRSLRKILGMKSIKMFKFSKR